MSNFGAYLIQENISGAKIHWYTRVYLGKTMRYAYRIMQNINRCVKIHIHHCQQKLWATCKANIATYQAFLLHDVHTNMLKPEDMDRSCVYCILHIVS